jgi:beta-lactamase regulating signal transducer with metallopeptidase domain
MNMIRWFDHSLALRLVQALLHFLWQGCAVALAVALAGATLKRASANLRYWFYVAAMAAMVMCLPVTFTLIDVPQSVETASQAVTTRPAPGAAGPLGAGLSNAAGTTSAGTPNGNTPRDLPSPRGIANWLASRGNRLLSWLTPFAPLVTTAYFVGVALMTLRLTVALRGGRRLRQSAVPVEDERVLAMIERQIGRMGVKFAPAVAFCERISIPIVVGIVKPAILLPAALASALAPDQLEALFAHELAHVRRFDLLVNLFQRLAEAVLFFHPAVWFVSRRISMEREIAADDMVLAAGWQRVNYADALLRMAEMSSALRNTRLVTGENRPMLRLSGAGSACFLTVLIVIAMTPLLVQAWARSPGELRALGRSLNEQDQAKDTPAQSPPAPASPGPKNTNAKDDHPSIIIAEHVLLWDNQVVTWDQIVARLRVKRKSGPFRATFYTTNGLSRKDGAWQDFHDRIMALYRELFEPVGVTFASASPRSSARFDAIRTADDLRPDPRRAVSGQVVTPFGEPARDAQVIVLPADGPFAALDVALSEARMRDSFDEQWSPTDEKGHFVVYPADDSYTLAILHSTGFATQAGATKDALIRLQPWATVTFTSTGDVADQQADVGIRPIGTRPGSPGFRVYSIKTKGKPIEVKVPPGEIAVSRSLDMGQGTAVSLPVEEFTLGPGESRVFELKRPTDAERKKAKEVYDRLHGPDEKVASPRRIK